MNSPAPLLAAWRAATATAHKQLEANLDLLGSPLTPARYRELLEGYFRFYAAFESLLHVHAAAPAAAFYLADREKLSWLRADLAALGNASTDHALRSAVALPEAWGQNPAALWGVLYVVEGSMLGGQVIAKHFAEKLGAATPLRFYRAYGAETGKKWKEFLAQAELLTLSPSETEAAVEAARAAFKLLGDQLVPRAAAT